jgi:ribosomal protein S6--L-glutamate ligase
VGQAGGDGVRISLVSDRPAHPVLSAMLQELDVRHRVAVLSAEDADPAALAAQEARALADVYLLEAHSPAALDLARRLERCGGLVVNGSAATGACQDRVLMARRLAGAGLPCPRTWSVSTLGRARRLLAALHFPLVVKSRYRRPGDLVTQVHGAEEMEALMPQWGGEPVILQQYQDNDGWDVKLWVVGGHAFAARRRTPLVAGASREAVPVAAGDLSAAWVAATLRVGREFDLSLFGVDLLVTARGPAIVDVNAFPGYGGVPGAAAALAAFTEGLSMEASATA